jgi:hypothetical protein
MTEEKLDEIFTAIESKLTPEQADEFVEFGNAIVIPVGEALRVFVEKMLEGKTGWKEASDEKIHYQMGKALESLKAGNEEADLDIINWAFIHYIKRNNERGEN